MKIKDYTIAIKKIPETNMFRGFFLSLNQKNE